MDKIFTYHDKASGNYNKLHFFSWDGSRVGDIYIDANQQNFDHISDNRDSVFLEFCAAGVWNGRYGGKAGEYFAQISQVLAHVLKQDISDTIDTLPLWHSVKVLSSKLPDAPQGSLQITKAPYGLDLSLSGPVLSNARFAHAIDMYAVTEKTKALCSHDIAQILLLDEKDLAVLSWLLLFPELPTE